MLALFFSSFSETLMMVSISSILGALFGMPLGITLHLTGRFRYFTGSGNSVYRFFVGTSIATATAIVPLTIASAPFIERLVETALREVKRGLIEAAQVMGATTQQVAYKVLVPNIKAT